MKIQNIFLALLLAVPQLKSLGAPPLVEFVVRKNQAVVLSLKPTTLILEPTGGEAGLGQLVFPGQSFALKDGEKLRFFDPRARVLYDVRARLSATPPSLFVLTHVGEGVQNPADSVPAKGTVACRGFSIPVE